MYRQYINWIWKCTVEAKSLYEKHSMGFEDQLQVLSNLTLILLLKYLSAFWILRLPPSKNMRTMFGLIFAPGALATTAGQPFFCNLWCIWNGSVQIQGLWRSKFIWCDPFIPNIYIDPLILYIYFPQAILLALVHRCTSRKVVESYQSPLPKVDYKGDPSIKQVSSPFSLRTWRN